MAASGRTITRGGAGWVTTPRRSSQLVTKFPLVFNMTPAQLAKLATSNNPHFKGRYGS